MSMYGNINMAFHAGKLFLSRFLNILKHLHLVNPLQI